LRVFQLFALPVLIPLYVLDVSFTLKSSKLPAQKVSEPFIQFSYAVLEVAIFLVLYLT